MRKYKYSPSNCGHKQDRTDVCFIDEGLKDHREMISQGHQTI